MSEQPAIPVGSTWVHTGTVFTNITVPITITAVVRDGQAGDWLVYGVDPDGHGPMVALPNVKYGFTAGRFLDNFTRAAVPVKHDPRLLPLP